METAGGRIHCKRCQAKARSGLQCAKPAVRGKRVCRNHGGASTGPKTLHGRQKIREANLIHGERSVESIAASSRMAIKLRKLEDALFLVGATHGPRRSGRKPAEYIPLVSLDDVWKFLSELAKVEQ